VRCGDWLAQICLEEHDRISNPTDLATNHHRRRGDSQDDDVYEVIYKPIMDIAVKE
jgi:hypothetical protein